MHKRKSSISKARNYEEIAEFWDTHDLTDYWDQLEPVEFEVDIQSEVIYYAIDRELSAKIQYIAKKHGISADTLINLWLQDELQEDQTKPVESEFVTILNKKYYAIDIELSDKIHVIAKQWDVSANALVNLWLQRRIQRDSLEVDTYKSNTQLPSRQYPIDKELSEKIRAIAKKRGISANTLVNLWLQKELQEQKIPIKIST
jgi:antitoxin component of RelBE/YafQ-DinJ toxin-antitoxin module